MKFFGLVALIGAIVSAVVALPDGYGHQHGHGHDHGHGYHHGHGHVHAGPAVEYSYPAKLPEVKCGHNLVISCNPHHGAVPCKAHAPAHY